MVKTPATKTAASTSARGAITLRRSKYAADATHTSAAITHQLDGRHKYFPAQSPPANANAAHSKGCRDGVRFLKFGGLAKVKRDGDPALQRPRERLRESTTSVVPLNRVGRHRHG